MNEMKRKRSRVVWFEELEDLEEIFRCFLKKFSEIQELEEESSRRRGFKEYKYNYLRVLINWTLKRGFYIFWTDYLLGAGKNRSI